MKQLKNYAVPGDIAGAPAKLQIIAAAGAVQIQNLSG